MVIEFCFTDSSKLSITRERENVPTLVVHGLSNTSANRGDIKELLRWGLPKAASSVEVMKITPGLVTVKAPVDLDANGSADIVVFVEGLWQRNERTEEVLNEFCDAIKECVREFVEKFVPECNLIEVIPRSQRASDGFASWVR